MQRNMMMIYFAMIAAALTATAARAEAPAQPTEQAPEAHQSDDSAGKTASDVPLSKKLDENDGVIKPPHGVDPEIHKPPPETTGSKMPVIIPPGEPGGDQSIQPK